MTEIARFNHERKRVVSLTDIIATIELAQNQFEEIKRQ